MTQPTTTRRDLLRLGTSAAAYAAGAAIVTGGVALASQAKGSALPVDRQAWDAAVAAYLAAEKAADDHWTRIEGPATAELDRLFPHPRSTFSVTALNGSTGSFVINPAKRDEYEQAGIQLRDAARAAFARYDAGQAAAKALGMDRIHAESDALGSARMEAEDRLFETPAPDVAAVAFKLHVLWQDNRDPIPEFNALILANVARLSGGEA